MTASDDDSPDNRIGGGHGITRHSSERRRAAPLNSSGGRLWLDIHIKAFPTQIPSSRPLSVGEGTRVQRSGTTNGNGSLPLGAEIEMGCEAAFRSCAAEMLASASRGSGWAAVPRCRPHPGRSPVSRQGTTVTRGFGERAGQGKFRVSFDICQYHVLTDVGKRLWWFQ